MDPEETYQLIHTALYSMHEAQNDGEYLDAATNLLIAVENLDDWLVKGGFLPQAWKSHRISDADEPIRLWATELLGSSQTNARNRLLAEYSGQFGEGVTWRQVYGELDRVTELLDIRNFGNIALEHVFKQFSERGLMS